MLTLRIPKQEKFNEATGEFVWTNEYVLKLEHSLVSISKWEARWKKAFLGKDSKTNEETLDYIICMTITQNIPAEAYGLLTSENIQAVEAYIKDPMTATILPEGSGSGPNREIITSELIYYWMVAHNIPFECQKWHLNRLLALVQICNIKNAPPKKRGKSDIMRRNRELNAQRRSAMNTQG